MRTVKEHNVYILCLNDLTALKQRIGSFLRSQTHNDVMGAALINLPNYVA